MESTMEFAGSRRVPRCEARKQIYGSIALSRPEQNGLLQSIFSESQILP
jgi:hypothetical protein